MMCRLRPDRFVRLRHLLAIAFSSFSGIGFVIFLVAASPYLIKTARAKSDRAFASTSAPPPALPAKVSPPATQVPSAMPSQQATLSADEQAQNLWSDFEKTTWGAPFEAWTSLQPDIPCKPFRGEMWGGTADRQWAQRCSVGPRLEAAHWSFYVFGLQMPQTVPQSDHAAYARRMLPRLKLGFDTGQRRFYCTISD
jgi:hypothetical protein